MKSKALCCVLSIAAFLVTTTSQAGTLVTSQLTSVGNNNEVRLNINHGDSTNNFFAYGYAGYMNWTQAPANNNPALNNTFTSFCIELTQNISIGGTYQYEITALESAPTPGSPQTGQPNGMGQLKPDAIRKLWAGAYSSTMTDTQAAAFQLAIWRLEYDFTNTKTIAEMTNFSAGNFRANGANSDGTVAVSLAQSLITKVMDGTFTQMEMNLIALSSDTRQDQITVVPEPTTMSMTAVGGLTLLVGGALRRRRKQRFAVNAQNERV
jgi:hypothetical protein